MSRDGSDRRNGRKPRQLRLSMHSRRDAVPVAVDRVLDEVAGAGLSADQTHSLAVALAEALSNAAVHGNRLSPRRKVRIAVDVDPGRRVRVDVTDSGDGFDAERLDDPTAPDRLLETRGRGVYLMRRLLDGLEYNARGNRVRLLLEPAGDDAPGGG